MKFAIVVGSYGLPDFIRLQALSLRHIFGLDARILVSDDWSDKSVEIAEICVEFDLYHLVGGPRGHFAGDAQALTSGLAFAESEHAEILLKLSQRLVLCEPVVREILERYFSDPNLNLILPGKIPVATIKRAESRFFANLSNNSDVIAVRVGAINPLEVKELYEARVNARRGRHDALIEGFLGNLIDTRFAGKFAFAPEFTVPYPGRAPLYLRKCQAEPADYLNLAERLGMRWKDVPLLQEWRQLSQSYRPIPQFA